MAFGVLEIASFGPKLNARLAFLGETKTRRETSNKSQKPQQKRPQYAFWSP
jgi:hypothetical protein